MSIIQPETDIKLWFSIFSQSLQTPEELNCCIQQLKAIFSEVINNPSCLSTKYKISKEGFYYSICSYILNPVLKMDKIAKSSKLNLLQVILDLLTAFVYFLNSYLSTDDQNFNEILYILFAKPNKLYQLNNQLYFNVCKSFIDFRIFNIFLNYIQRITNSNEIYDKDLIIFSNKFPFLVNSLINSFDYLEDKQLTFKSLAVNCIHPFLKAYKFLNEKNANFIFQTIIEEMKSRNQIDAEIINLWVVIFEHYLKFDNFILILFSLSSTASLISQSQFKTVFLSILQRKNHSGIVKQYLSISIHEDFCKYLQVIYSTFLSNGLIDIPDLLPIWNSQSRFHASVLPSFFSIFTEIAQTVPAKAVDSFIDMILNTVFLNEQWLECVIQIAVTLGNRKMKVSKFINLLSSICDGKFDFGQLGKNEIKFFRETANKALPELLSNSFDKSNYFSFLKEIDEKISSKLESSNDIEILSKSLSNFSINRGSSFLQELFEKAISIFDEHDTETMKKIIERLASSSYGCQFNEKLVKKLLLFTKSKNKNLTGEIYSFVSDLRAKNKIPADLLLNVLISSNLEINQPFYKTIKMIVYDSNNGGKVISKFPFNYEDVLWNFSFSNHNQTLSFQKLLSRLYMKNSTSDKEMIESFVSNLIMKFKALYNAKAEKKEDSQKNKNEAFELFSSLLCAFLEKVESPLYIPYQYHFSEYKLNKINIQINDDKQPNNQINFDFDQRRKISGLIQYIQITNQINNDITIKYQNKNLNEKLSIEDEIGISNLNAMKEKNLPLILTFSVQQTNKKKIKTRTIIPSYYIVNNIKGLSDILFQSKTYSKLFYNLPTFPDTLTQIHNLHTNNFKLVFPYDNPIKFKYNFESYLDFYSRQTFSLSDDETIDKSYHDKFVKESGLIDYLISCGLSTSHVPLINLILEFIRDYYSGESVINNENLSNQFQSLIEAFYNPNRFSNVISSIFTFRVESLPSLSYDLLKKMLTHEQPSFRREARLFLMNVNIPLSYYGKIYDESKFDPNPDFYMSMADHIRLSRVRDNRVIQIVMLTCRRKNPNISHVQNLNAALQANVLNSEELSTISSYITGFIKDQLNCIPRQSLNEVIELISIFQTTEIIKCINDLMNIYDFSDRLKDFRMNKDSGMIDGEKIAFRGNPIYSNKTYIDFPIGLRNLGATCYVNSVLQALYLINDFRNFLLGVSKDNKNYQVVSALNLLFCTLQNSVRGFADPASFIKTYGGIEIKVQCDCCEFLQNLLDRFQVEIFDFNVNSEVSDINDKEMQIKSQEKFSVLSLAIRNIGGINESLKSYLAPDYLQNYEFYEGYRSDAKKSYYFDSFSDHLIIQLKRFEYNHQKQTIEKILTDFFFDSELEIAGNKFVLVAIVAHIGSSALNGHYIAYGRKFNTEKWFEFNDSNVKQVDLKSVLSIGRKNGYLLFYSRNDIDDVKVPVNKQLYDFNRHELCCRILFSQSFCYSMLKICQKLNNQNISQFEVSLLYYFQILPIYSNDKHQSEFGSVILSKCQSSDNDFASAILNSICKIWPETKMENLLLYNGSNCLRRYTCDILKMVVEHFDCFEEIVEMVKRSNKLWFFFLYSSSEFFELISFAFDNNLSMMLDMAKDNKWSLLFEQLFLDVAKCQNLKSDEVNLHFFFLIFLNFVPSNNFENSLANNVGLILKILETATPLDDISNLVLSLKNSELIIESLNNVQQKNKKLKLFLSKLCK